MDTLGGNLLQQAETLLRNGNRQAALPLLVEYLQRYPNSARGWWVLGIAVTDPRQQIDCMEHVLAIDPGFAPARARLEKLKQRLEPSAPFAFEQPAPQREPARPSAPAFEEQPAPSWASEPSAPYTFEEQARPAPVHPAPRRAPAKKSTGWVLPVMVGLILTCALFGVIGVIVIWNMQRTTLAAPLPVVSLVARTLEPTWTPTATLTPRPTLTPIPSYTPLPPLSLLDGPTGGGSGPAYGSPSIDFTLNSLDGERVSLSSYRGQPVLLFFWATWCPYCRNEVAALKDIHTAYKDQGLVVLAVEVGETASAGRSFRDQYDLSFPILSDTSGNVFRGYSGEAIPLNYFIDANGNVNYSQLGMMDYTNLNLRVRTLLNLIPTPVQ
ncbi:MAG: redoxin domain-containing protein [Chloroflexi bacterium]|nr:redoxin domain-containing protein [Chloroflexota bacterium]